MNIINKYGPFDQYRLVRWMETDAPGEAPIIAEQVKLAAGCAILKDDEVAKRTLEIMGNIGMKVKGVTVNEVNDWITIQSRPKPKTPGELQR